MYKALCDLGPDFLSGIAYIATLSTLPKAGHLPLLLIAPPDAVKLAEPVVVPQMS